jgi:hypothetical protein
MDFADKIVRWDRNSSAAFRDYVTKNEVPRRTLRKLENQN